MLFFSANDGVSGQELWKTDGTRAGTVMVKDIHPGLRSGSSPRGFTILNGQLFFTASNQYLSGAPKLWRTDGTTSGTLPVYEDGPYASGDFSQLTVANGKLYMSRGTGHLYQYDETTGETKETDVDDYYIIDELNTFNDELYFITNTSYRQQIRFYHLNADGEIILLEEFDQSKYGNIDIHNFTQVGKDIFFSITEESDADGETDVLWKTDGSPEGFVPVKSFDWDSHTYRSHISNFTAYKDELYFNGGSQNNFALWKSDGTAEETLAAAKNTSIGVDYRFCAGKRPSLFFQF